MSGLSKSNLNSKILKNFQNLKERELEIITLRFGLGGDKPKTLQAIGKNFKITRERVRQIINFALKKLQKKPVPELIKLSKEIEKLLSQNGDLIPETQIAFKIAPKDKTLTILGAIEVLCLINPKIKKIKKTPKTQKFWAMVDIRPNFVAKTNQILSQILDKNKKKKNKEELANAYLKHTQKSINLSKLQSIITGSNNLIVTPSGKIGLSSWPDINPKNTRDKIYYVLNEAGKPLHFTQITKNIVEKKFSDKYPTQTTVHNELISDDRFVLIGRGIYALKKWGFEKGTVFEILKKLVKQNRQGLSQDEICLKILKSRIVSKNTIVMNLNTHSCFVKNKAGNWTFKK